PGDIHPVFLKSRKPTPVIGKISVASPGEVTADGNKGLPVAVDKISPVLTIDVDKPAVAPRRLPNGERQACPTGRGRPRPSGKRPLARNVKVKPEKKTAGGRVLMA